MYKGKFFLDECHDKSDNKELDEFLLNLKEFNLLLIESPRLDEIYSDFNMGMISNKDLKLELFKNGYFPRETLKKVIDYVHFNNHKTVLLPLGQGSDDDILEGLLFYDTHYDLSNSCLIIGACHKNIIKVFV